MSDDLVRYFSTYSAMMAEDGDVKWVKYKDYKAAADRIEELEGQLQSILDRETSILRYYDAKLDAADAKLAKAIEALT